MATQERGIKDKIYSHLKRSQEDYKNPEYQPAPAPQNNGYGGFQQAGGPPPMMHHQGFQQAGGPPPMQYDNGFKSSGGFQQAGGPTYNHSEFQPAGGPPPPMQYDNGFQQAGGPISLQKQQQQPYDNYQQQQPSYDNYNLQPYQQQPYQQQQQQQQPQKHKHHHFHRHDDEAKGGDNIKIEDNGKKEWKEENDLTCLFKSLERSVHGQEPLSPESLIEGWIQEKETKLKRWRKGMKSGAGVQTFGLGLVTFGLGPIPINMALLASLNKHIVHTFTLDDERVDHFVKSTFAYGGKQLGKKLATLLAKTLFIEAGTSGAVGIVPLIGPMISATMTAHRISKTAKQTTHDCAELVREICHEALTNNKFDV